MKIEQAINVYNDDEEVISTIEHGRFYPNENAVAGYTHNELRFIADAIEREGQDESLVFCSKIKEPHYQTDISGLEAFPREARPDEPQGKEFVMLSGVYYGSHGLQKGDTVKLERNDRTGRAIFATRNGEKLWLPWDMLADIPKEEPHTRIDVSGLERFPLESRPDEPIGKQFVLMGDYYDDEYGLYAGDVVTLTKNQNNFGSVFSAKGRDNLILVWSGLAELPKEKGA